MNKNAKALFESAILIAMSVILSMIKIIDLPYGGSVTVACMLPIIIISYRHGLGYGLSSALVFGIIQQLLSLSTLSYVTTWQSVVAVILLDYVVAFVVCGLGGIFRRVIKNQTGALALGSILVCVLRYVCHVISGATVWAGISIPTGAAMAYSLIYNATYMVPETIITVIIACYIASTIDLRADRPVRIKQQTLASSAVLRAGAGFSITCGLSACIVLIFSKLQNAETGEFNFSQITEVNVPALIAIAVVCVPLIVALLVDMLSSQKTAQK